MAPTIVIIVLESNKELNENKQYMIIKKSTETTELSINHAIKRHKKPAVSYCMVTFCVVLTSIFAMPKYNKKE